MKLTLKKETGIAALQRVMGASEAKGTMQALNHVLITTVSDSLIQMTATNLEVTAKTTTEAAVQQQGGIAIPAKKLLAILQAVNTEDVHFEQISNQVEIIAGTAKFTLSALHPEDYPVVPEVAMPVFFNIQGKQLQRALLSVAHAVPDDDYTAVPGIIMHLDEGGIIRFIAVDGHQLAMFQTQVSSPAEDVPPLSHRVILSSKAVEAIAGAIDDDTEEVSIGLADQNIVVQTARTMLTIQTLESPDINVLAVIPMTTGWMSAARADLAAALRRMSVVASREAPTVRLIIDGEKLTLESGDPDMGMARETIPIEESSEGPFHVAFNLRYVQNAIRNVRGEKFRMEWVGPDRGCLFRDPEDSQWLGLIMPIITTG